MQIQNQAQQFATSEEFLLTLSEDEQAIVSGGGKHRRPVDPRHAVKPTGVLGRGLGLGLKVGASAIPGLGTALTIYGTGKAGVAQSP